MKAFGKALLGLTLLVSMSVSALKPAVDDSKFRTWMKENDKSYPSIKEFNHRFQVFLSNLERIEQMNLKNGKTVFGLNQFSDLTPAEFKQQYLMPSFAPSHQCRWNETRYSSASPTFKPPDSLDWRNYTPAVVVPPKDQGGCGSCWAFSTVANIEGQWALKTKSAAVSLSEEQIVDCSHSCEEYEGQKLCNGGCNGGLPWLAYEDIIRWGNLTTEQAYPYKSGGLCDAASKPFGARISNWTAVPHDMASIEAYLAQHGPLSITLNANILQPYYRGIIESHWFTLCDAGHTDHAVTLVGYGNDTTNTSHPIHYWIVKNSWGARWGEKGYFRIQADTDLCGIWDCVTSSIA